MHFDADTLRASIATLRCRFCGHVGVHATIELEGSHFARLVCPACDRCVEWLGWPPTAGKRERRRTARHADELVRLGADYCELCLRGRFALPPPDTLEVHHLDEDATNDDPANLRLYCTGCHRLTHWLRTYFGHYASA